MSGLLENKIALVTGAASGLGLEIARCFCREGASVMLADIDVNGLKSAAEELSKTGDVATVVNDVTDAGSCEIAVKETENRFGRLDIAVNNAGIFGSMKRLHECPLESWQQTQSINVNGIFYGMRAQIPMMLKQGSGAIINMASIVGKVATKSSVDYVTSKHAIVGLTRSAALDYANEGIRVNCVGPGLLDTAMANSIVENPDERMADAMSQAVANHPMGRIGKPGEAAELVAWLCSDKASFCTGSYYAVNGGYLAH